MVSNRTSLCADTQSRFQFLGEEVLRAVRRRAKGTLSSDLQPTSSLKRCHQAYMQTAVHSSNPASVPKSHTKSGSKLTSIQALSCRPTTALKLPTMRQVIYSIRDPGSKIRDWGVRAAHEDLSQAIQDSCVESAISSIRRPYRS